MALFEKDKCCRERIRVIKFFTPGIFIEIDPVHLCQIIWNLLLNAAEAIEGKGEIRLDLEKNKNQYACIRITDTGCGISKQHLNSIFNPFLRPNPMEQA